MAALNALKLMLGGAMFAGVLYAILAAPGFLSDHASTVPALHRIVMVRP